VGNHGLECAKFTRNMLIGSKWLTRDDVHSREIYGNDYNNKARLQYTARVLETAGRVLAALLSSSFIRISSPFLLRFHLFYI